MPMTSSFRESIQARIEKDPEYREELLRQAARCLACGDTETGNSLLQLCGEGQGACKP